MPSLDDLVQQQPNQNDLDQNTSVFLFNLCSCCDTADEGSKGAGSS